LGTSVQNQIIPQRQIFEQQIGQEKGQLQTQINQSGSLYEQPF
jgi:hypothetical protein